MESLQTAEKGLKEMRRLSDNFSINKPPTPDLANMRGMTLNGVAGTLLAIRSYFAYASANLVHDRVPGMVQLRRNLTSEVADILGFSRETPGLVKPSGSISNVDALYCAREGTQRNKVVGFNSSHSSILKAARRLKMSFESVPVQLEDNDGSLLLSRLDENTAALVLTLGTTELGHLEHVSKSVLDACLDKEIHVHIDAAYGGFQFGLLPKGHPLKEKFEEVVHHQAVRTVTVDPHKFVGPYDCSVLLFPRGEPQFAETSPEYLEGVTHVQETTRGAQVPYQTYETMCKIGRDQMAKAALNILDQAKGFEAVMKRFEFDPISPAQSGVVNIKLQSSEEAEYIYNELSDGGWIVPKPVRIETENEVLHGVRFVLVPGEYYDSMFMEDFSKYLSSLVKCFRNGIR